MATQQPATIPELLVRRAAEDPHRPAFFRRLAPGRWVPSTRRQLAGEVGRLAATFYRLGLRPGAKLAILAPCCPEWMIGELAALHLGAVVVGVDPHAPAEQIEFALRHAQVRSLVVYDSLLAAKVPPAVLAEMDFYVLMHGEAASENGHSWERLVAVPVPETPPAVPTPHDPATLIYTSGTTGRPKAILFRHQQLMAACRAIANAFPELGPNDTVLAWLPMAHLFQRMINLVALQRGATIYFAPDPREIAACLAEVRPTAFVGVPRFFERVYETINHRIAAMPRMAQGLVRWALAIGNQWAHATRHGRRPSIGLRLRHSVADRLVLRRLRKFLGGRVRFLLTGSAPTPLGVLEFFHALGLVLLEAYGVSENAIPMAANRPSAYRFGSVGRPLEENGIRLAEDGEILVRSLGLFSGYFREEETRELFTADGYYRTGDLGRFDAEGFLYLTGRKSDLIKTSTGRRIAPARIEAIYAQSPLIDQVVVVGNGRKHLVGLVVPNLASLRRRLPGLRSLPPEQLPTSAEVRALLAAEIETLGQQLAPHERIVRFAILPEPFSVQRGEITPTLKLRRDRIAHKYATLIEQLYECESPLDSPPCLASSSPAPPA